jgi:hypothetical protein
MKGIIEAGVVLLIIYLFLQWEKNGGAAGPLAANPISTLFNESPGSPTTGYLNESGPSSGGSVTGSAGGGCCCGGGAGGSVAAPGQNPIIGGPVGYNPIGIDFTTPVYVTPQPVSTPLAPVQTIRYSVNTI